MRVPLTSGCQRVAHRGGAALAPENTLAAFRHARTLPVDALELDVRMSRDGQLIVFHDATIERLTGVQGTVLDLDLAELLELNVAARFLGSWPENQQIPVLAEVLALARESHLKVFIEIKPGERDGSYEHSPEIAQAVVRAVLAENMLEQVQIMSFDWTLLPEIKALAPAMTTGALVSREMWQPRAPSALAHLVARVKELQCSWVDLATDLFTPEMPGFFHAQGLLLGIWTVNDAASLRRLAAAGVDALTSDRPDLFVLLADPEEGMETSLPG